jgi:nitroreductase
MEALECLAKRISIRKFEAAKMSEAEIKKILTAGFEAPSAMNRRPYEFIVNTDNAFWHELAPFKPTCDIMKDASLTVLIVGDSNKNPTNEFLIEDCSCCAENMLLAAKALGYDSLWAGIKWQSDFYNHLIAYFHLPDGFIPVTVLSFGKPGEKKVQVERYDEKKVHHGKF